MESSELKRLSSAGVIMILGTLVGWLVRHGITNMGSTITYSFWMITTWLSGAVNSGILFRWKMDNVFVDNADTILVIDLIIACELLEMEPEETEEKAALSSPWNEEYRTLSDNFGVAGRSLSISATTVPSRFRRLRDPDALNVVNILQVS
jgi:hypothetical protein